MSILCFQWTSLRHLWCSAYVHICTWPVEVARLVLYKPAVLSDAIMPHDAKESNVSSQETGGHAC